MKTFVVKAPEEVQARAGTFGDYRKANGYSPSPGYENVPGYVIERDRGPNDHGPKYDWMGQEAFEAKFVAKHALDRAAPEQVT